MTTICSPLRYLLEEVGVDKRDGYRRYSSWGNPLKTCFYKPDNPVINLPDPDGYRKPSGYRAGTDRLALLGDVSSAKESTYVAYTLSGTAGVVGPDISELANATFNEEQYIRTKILNNVKDEVFDAAMVLAEMQGTVSTAVTLLNRVGRGMKALKDRKPESFYYLLNGRRKDGRRPTERFLKETASEYLMWKYGVQPTMFDIKGVCEALDIQSKGTLFNNPPLLVARANIKDSTKTRARFSGIGPLNLDVEIVSEYKARLDFSVNAEGLRGLSRYGIGLSTIGTVLWDKHPFTFVLDMAVPIASLIKAWGALSGVDVRGYCETKHITYKHAGSSHTLSAIGWPDARLVLKKNEVSTFRRKAFGSPPMPLPFVKNPLSTGNISTVLALFTALRK